MIQSNALRSWAALKPGPEILVSPNSEADGDRIRALGGSLLPLTKTNQYGTPLVSHLFRLGEKHARHDYLCYVNSDMILFRDFVAAFKLLRNHLDRFLMVGRRFNWRRPRVIDFTGNLEKLMKKIRSEGRWHNQSATDYWVFWRGLFPSIPPFALGRYAWDNWLCLRGKQLAPLVDATGLVFAVHQGHPQRLGPAARQERGSDPERVRNLELAGDLVRLGDKSSIGGPGGADYVLTKEGLRKR